ncbi:hypothetical protein PVAP13_5KG587100 [Panicum virgatum]|uniref:Cysteine proteinase inhibitor n=1 Tax=Panicum virgatum TaxID=38727 RepID=A0A8T0SZ57_PANVG|nr:hypothetical protein PVAP13_5KG587100 [Panicum virgatum]
MCFDFYHSAVSILSAKSYNLYVALFPPTTMKRLADAYMSCTGSKLRLPMAACMDNQLEFEKLVKVKEQPVAGTLYYFTIEAKDGEAKKLYEARVYECPWMNLTELADFKPADC